MKNLITTFICDEDGATLVEYGVALLVVIIVGSAALITLARSTAANFTAANTAVIAR